MGAKSASPPQLSVSVLAGVGGKKEAPQTGISLGAVNLGLLEGRQSLCPAQRLDRKEVDVTGEVTDRHTNHIFGNRN